MCIAIYKPINSDFPSKATLKRCFAKNPDGAGYMYALNGCVYIRKGFMRFEDFWRSLKDIRAKNGDKLAYVLHFRISTQAGIRADCCHPYPLSEKMQDLRALKIKAKIGVAHNGIISLTSSGYHKTITYNDTMQFITDYLSLIIRDKNYYKDKNTLLLIERLVGSRLAILDGGGHCELIGEGWREDGGVWYSNASYQESAYTYTSNSAYNKYYYTDYTEADASEFSQDYYSYYMNSDGMYELDEWDCPLTLDGDDSYCQKCTNYIACYIGIEEDGENDI